MNDLNVAPVLSAILWAAKEDFHGLWEYPGEVQGAMGTSGGIVPASLAIARAVLLAFLVDGLVEFLWCDEPYGDMRAMSLDEAMVVIDDSHHWVVPDDGATGVRVGSTRRGEAVYERLSRRDDARS